MQLCLVLVYVKYKRVVRYEGCYDNNFPTRHPIMVVKLKGLRSFPLSTHALHADGYAPHLRVHPPSVLDHMVTGREICMGIYHVYIDILLYILSMPPREVGGFIPFPLAEPAKRPSLVVARGDYARGM